MLPIVLSKIQFRKRLEEARLRRAREEEEDIISRLLNGEVADANGIPSRRSPPNSPTSAKSEASRNPRRRKLSPTAGRAVTLEQEIVQKVLAYEAHLNKVYASASRESEL